MKINFVFYCFLLSQLLILTGCQHESSVSSQDVFKEPILARIGNKTITVDEFIHRAEYTIRPQYCRLDNNLHKKIVLNSLVAEKLLAIEADSLILELNQQDYLKGRKEQRMRDLLFIRQAVEKVNLDTNLVSDYISNAVRKYKVNYFALKDSSAAAIIKKMIADEIPFNDIYTNLFNTDSLPVREVEYFSESDAAICSALYERKVENDEVIGPIRTKDGSYLFLQITGWTSTHRLTPSGMRVFANQVSEKLRNDQAKSIYSKWVSELMQGMTMNLEEKPFKELVEILAEHYFSSKTEEDESLQMTLWQEDIIPQSGDKPVKASFNRNSPLIELNGEIITLDGLEEMVRHHPLVFRKKQIGKKEFAQQLKFAIADLIRDSRLTRKAYQHGLDKDPIVKREIALWQDNFLSHQKRSQVLLDAGFEGQSGENYIAVIEQYLDPYVNDLQQKYSDLIEINTDLLDSIRLTRIDMFTTYQNLPYPVVVPDFPLLTTDHQLDYGSKMK